GVLGQAVLEEVEPDVANERLEVDVGHDGDGVAAPLQRQPQADERMHVPRTADGNEEQLHGIFPETSNKRTARSRLQGAVYERSGSLPGGAILFQPRSGAALERFASASSTVWASRRACPGGLQTAGTSPAARPACATPLPCARARQCRSSLASVGRQPHDACEESWASRPTLARSVTGDLTVRRSGVVEPIAAIWGQASSATARCTSK